MEQVNTQLMPFDKALELCTIAFSSKASTPDIVYANDSTFLQFAKNGWIRPLDDLWAKYKDEFQLDEDSPTVRKERAWQGHGSGGVPATANAMLFFYRQDLFEKAKETATDDVRRVSRSGKILQLTATGRDDQLPAASGFGTE